MAFKIKSERVPGVERKQFTEGSRFYYYVRIYIVSENSDADLDRVESVQYFLHPTFKQRIQVSTESDRGFEIRIWTYGFFKIEARILFREGDKPVEIVAGFVKWEVER